jgi:hypothetical protein
MRHQAEVLLCRGSYRRCDDRRNGLYPGLSGLSLYLASSLRSRATKADPRPVQVQDDENAAGPSAG